MKVNDNYYFSDHILYLDCSTVRVSHAETEGGKDQSDTAETDDTVLNTWVGNTPHGQQDISLQLYFASLELLKRVHSNRWMICVILAIIGYSSE